MMILGWREETITQKVIIFDFENSLTINLETNLIYDFRYTEFFNRVWGGFKYQY